MLFVLFWIGLFLAFPQQFGIETFLFVSIQSPGMVLSCFDSHNLVMVFLLYSSSFPNLLKILLDHLSLIHFRFLLSLANYFLILLFVSSALSLDIFWLLVVVCWKLT